MTQPVVKIAELVRAEVGDSIPIILFPKGSHTALRLLGGPNRQHYLRLFNVISLDYTVDPQEARELLKSPADGLPEECFSLQGNLDPCVLYCEPAVIEERVTRMLRDFGVSKGCSAGVVANLGHGMLPDHNPEHAMAFVNAVHKVSKALIGGQEGESS